jgi:hypothetical protein
VLFVDSSEPAAAPEFAELIDPDPLMPDESFVAVSERCRIEVVSAVLEALVPVSRSAAVPMLSVSVLLQPTSATMNAVANKVFFISCSSLFAEKRSRRLIARPRLFETQNVQTGFVFSIWG